MYCSAECQKAHWRQGHKTMCRALLLREELIRDCEMARLTEVSSALRKRAKELLEEERRMEESKEEEEEEGRREKEREEGGIK